MTSFESVSSVKVLSSKFLIMFCLTQTENNIVPSHNAHIPILMNIIHINKYININTC